MTLTKGHFCANIKVYSIKLKHMGLLEGAGNLLRALGGNRPSTLDAVQAAGALLRKGPLDKLTPKGKGYDAEVAEMRANGFALKRPEIDAPAWPDDPASVDARDRGLAADGVSARRTEKGEQAEIADLEERSARLLAEITERVNKHSGIITTKQRGGIKLSQEDNDRKSQIDGLRAELKGVNDQLTALQKAIRARS